jgi:hypothetical protein
MTGTERNRRWKLKKFGEKPKRKPPLTGAERQTKLRNIRKVARIRELIIRETREIAPTAGTSLNPSLATRSAAYLLLSKDTDELHRHNLYRTPHHDAQ